MMQICEDEHCNIVYKIQLMNAIKSGCRCETGSAWLLDYFFSFFSRLQFTRFSHGESHSVPQICLFIWPSCSLISHVISAFSGDYTTFLSPSCRGAMGPNRMESENVCGWPPGCKWSADLQWLPPAAAAAAVNDGISCTPATFITPAAAGNADYLISGWIGRWSLLSGGWVGSRSPSGANQ